MSDYDLIKFQKSQVIFLQHPRERGVNNRSVPLIELCVMGGGVGGGKKWGGYTVGAEKYGKKIAKGDDFNMMTVIGRRLGDKVDLSIMRLINDPWGNQIMVFPSEVVVSLVECMKEVEWCRSKGRGCRGQEELVLDGVGEKGASGVANLVPQVYVAR